MCKTEHAETEGQTIMLALEDRGIISCQAGDTSYLGAISVVTSQKRKDSRASWERSSAMRKVKLDTWGIQPAFTCTLVLHPVMVRRQRAELLKACVKRKAIAFDHFKTWYW